ncbi:MULTISPECIES: hypothetical protein [Brevibacterium]|jgi:hypothetical protein|uniref:hypothetical protein n=1 Tax=Brevibacterium TaxID=1696 RepID=UPI001BAE1BDC|nr:hypothetical protein [Brevibacterium sp. W7.2]
MFTTRDRIRRRWRRSENTAQNLEPARRLFPTNRIRDAVMTRRGLKWGVPAMLLAAPYFAIILILTDRIEHGGPGWLHLIVLLCAWNALKMLWLGPISLVRLARARLREHGQRRRIAHDSQAPDEARKPRLVPAGGAS